MEEQKEFNEDKKDEKQEVKNQEKEAPEEVKGITLDPREAEAFDRISQMEKLLNVEVNEVVSEAVAFNQVSIFLNYYRVNLSTIALKEGAQIVETILNRVIQGIREGQLTISEDNELTVEQILIHSPENNSVKYAKIQARHKRAMGSEDTPEKKQLAFVSVLTGVDVKAVAKFQGSDMSVMEAVAQLFTLV